MEKAVSEELELVDQLDSFTDGNPIKNDLEANNALLSIMHRRQETKRWQDHFKAQAESIKTANERFEEWQKYRLQRYFDTVPHKSTKTQEKYQLMDGELVFKDKATDYEIVDEDKLVKYLEQEERTAKFIKIKKEVDWKELKKQCTVYEGDVLMSDTCEVLPGIVATEHSDRVFSVSVKK